MANSSSAFGLAPIRYLNGASWNGAVNLYSINSNDTNAYFVGDCVASDTTYGADAFGVPSVTVGAAGSALRGVITAIGGVDQNGSFIGDPNNLSLTSIPATKTKTYYVLVADDPNVLFEVMEGGVGTVGAATNINQNANLHVGTPATGVFVSGTYLDNNTYATTTTLNFKVMGVAQRTDNTPYAANQKLVVLIYNHELRVG